MKLGMEVFFAALMAAGYLLAPMMLTWGWVRWIWRREELGPPFFLAFIGFVISTASALLAITAIAYAAATHGFPFYDPKLLRIVRWGLSLSLGAVILGFTGISVPNALRWQAPLAGLGMLAFWILSAEGE